MASRNALNSPDSYTVAWITALPIKRAAAEAILDKQHPAPTSFIRHQTDANVFYGTTSAATTTLSLLASLLSIRVDLLVGIGSGIARPDEGRDIRLGDVVVSQPGRTTGGVCQYDMIKANYSDKRERKGFLGRPLAVLLNALTSIQADHERKDSKIPCFIQEILEKNPKINKRSKQNPGYAYQGFDNDRILRLRAATSPARTIGAVTRLTRFNATLETLRDYRIRQRTCQRRHCARSDYC
ncbi:Pfs NACHT and ankyrin domain-containing protein [Penicillium subrubescens]|uniref:Pfs NACHT and ankyrin domain-containing protein n=1 Tax=Penicillium subrubescens TaxID=1316194 RepID=UPI0025457F6E|nr:Pfs NACHT and ankyrin domain-containing protein [Penicillium subrubescens]KAJ5911033.1 Pfs NACHT and ankyrin domain-containing protein [Penicillium subrubescens]